MDLALKPRITSKVRMKYDSTRNMDFLLLPERIVKLNESAAAILNLCDGSRSVSEIQQQLRRRFDVGGVESDVVSFLIRVVDQGWVQLHED